MLNRRIQIQKYTKALRTKNRLQPLKNHTLLKHKLVSKQQQGIKQQERDNNQQEEIEVEEGDPIQYQDEVSEEDGEACWNDSDGEEQMPNVDKNKIKKLTKLMRNPEQLTLSKYERKVSKFYSNKFEKVNWAQSTDQNIDTIEEKDVADYLNEEIFYANDKIKSKAKKVVKFSAKTPQKHDSIVSGLQWEKNVMFTCGYDKKLFVYHYDRDGHGNDEKMKLEKQIYIKDLPLSKCYYHNGQIIMGSLHKNLVIVDANKWQPSFITSNFMKELQNYENLRVFKSEATASQRKCALFKNKNICLLDKNNVYTGSLISNSDILDFTFSSYDPHYCYSTTSEAIYQWDLRKMQASGLAKHYLNYTTMSETKEGNLALGSKLGTVYIYSIQQTFRNQQKVEPIENSNLLTDVTNISCNHSGDMMLALSKWKSNAARVIGMDNGRAIKDWPAPNTKLGLGLISKWGTNYQDDWFSIGNANGQTQIYELTSEN